MTIFLLRSKRLSEEQKALVTSALLDNLVAIPIRDLIQVTESGQIKIQGRTLDPEGSISFRESVVALRNSYARKVIHDQMLFKAVTLGVHTGNNTDMIVFSKAAIWVIQQEDKLLSTLTQEF